MTDYESHARFVTSRLDYCNELLLQLGDSIYNWIENIADLNRTEQPGAVLAEKIEADDILTVKHRIFGLNCTSNRTLLKAKTGR